jgi:hypothetical protein
VQTDSQPIESGLIIFYQLENKLKWKN